MCKKNNSGRCNSGDNNSGNFNSGYRNTGDFNSGYRNTGDFNSGNFNTGYRNTGYRNTGHFNTGDFNTGHCNTGDFNTGYRNSGDFNTGYRNSGDFNTITPYRLMFNKPISEEEYQKAKYPNWLFVRLTKWVLSKNMSKEEKEENPEYETTNGYLKSYSSLQEAWKESWDNTTQEDRDLTRKLPNFDDEVFKEIFGFSALSKKESKKSKNTIIIDNKLLDVDDETYILINKLIKILR